MTVGHDCKVYRRIFLQLQDPLSRAQFGLGSDPMTAVTWEQRLARRTHALGGSEITAILSLAGATDVITFSGGFPEPATFATGTLADIAARLIAEDPGV